MKRIVGWFTMMSLAACWGILVHNLLLAFIGGFIIGMISGWVYEKLTGENLMPGQK